MTPETMMTTKIVPLDMVWGLPRCGMSREEIAEHEAALPSAVWRSDDGRVRAVYADGSERIYAELNDLADVHPWRSYRAVESGAVAHELPALPATYTAVVDWAAIHHAATEVDRARRSYRSIDVLPGAMRAGDAYGGGYWYGSFNDSLSGLIRLLRGTERIADDAWHLVHGASRSEDGIERARLGCRVAIACSRLFRLLADAGICRDPEQRICGTGEGYGLTGLRWLAGERCESRTPSRAAVEAFASGADLHEALAVSS